VQIGQFITDILTAFFNTCIASSVQFRLPARLPARGAILRLIYLFMVALINFLKLKRLVGAALKTHCVTTELHYSLVSLFCSLLDLCIRHRVIFVLANVRSKRDFSTRNVGRHQRLNNGGKFLGKTSARP
jgi:hypothetical protein